MIEYNIPQHLQDDGSDDCGPIATLMILDYFGVTSDRKKVLEKVERSNWGTSTYANALALKDYGLDTTLVTIQPKIFHGDFLATNPGKDKIIDRVKEEQEAVKGKTAKDIKDKKANLEMLIKYLESGAKFKLAIPTKQIIVSALKRGNLIWASTYTRILGKDQGGHHTIIIAGYKDDKFLIYNPWPHSRRKSWEDIEKIIFAIHSVTDFDYDNGAIILVGKKS